MFHVLFDRLQRGPSGRRSEVGWRPQDTLPVAASDVWSSGAQQDAEKVMALAAEEDPDAAAEAERTKTREAVAKHREKKAQEQAPPTYVSRKGSTIDDDAAGRGRSDLSQTSLSVLK